MRYGLFAFACAASFVGASLYINFVEQPARLALDVRSMIEEWLRSNRRGFVLLCLFAFVSALAAYIEYARTGDVRWVIGGTVILANLPYNYFVVTPLNLLLWASPQADGGSAARELLREWGLLEWGQTAIGVAACCMFAWAIVLPA
jgi:hypothetical protein